MRESRQFVVALDGSIVIQAGQDAHFYVHVAPSVPDMVEVGPAAGVGRRPSGPAVFVGRSAELGQLVTAVAGRGSRVVVHGLGGVGKSALVARFTAMHGHRFSPVWWMTADSPAAVRDGVAEFAVAMAPEAAGLPSDQRFELGLRWLSTHEGWLLVLDNVATPADADVLWERVRTGTVVITSRRANGWHTMHTVALDVLSADEGVDMVTRIVHAEWPDADLTDADALCQEVGWLPLAVEQVAAYLAQTRITPNRYLEMLARYPARMFTTTAEGGNAQRTMARVWHVTLDRLADTPRAGALLRQLAWYAPDTIPRGVLPDGPDTLDALGRLAAYSMITLTWDAVSVHRLVQAVTRTPDPNDPHRHPGDIDIARDTAATDLAAALNGLSPQAPADWPTYQRVLPHGRALLTKAHSDTDTFELCELANKLGIYLGGHGETTTAIAYLTRACDGSERILGRLHPDTLMMRNNLASAFQSAGDLDRATTLYKATLADRERALGPDHPHTLSSRNNLAMAYLSADDLDRATPLLETTLVDRLQVLGPDHPDTLDSGNNLAGAYQSAGDPDRAIPLFETTLVDRLRVLGPDHPDTLDSRGNLALAYQSMGDLGRATPLHEATLTDRERALGPDHPHTLISRNNLASAYESMGDLGGAIPLYEANLAACERILGPDHPYTLDSRNHVAMAYVMIGDPGRAIPLYEASLADHERVLGPDHPITRDVREQLEIARTD